MSLPALPSFEEFFLAVHGHEPFPWQARLARQVLDQDQGWPDLLDLPTGTGKTSALDVALYALAAAPARMPRRTLLVVDRRIVVDQGAEHARRLRQKMMAGREGPAAAVAARLRALWGGEPDEAPFAIATMRGGMPRDNDWAKRPEVPVLGVSTIDQVGSRLLFRGYGVSPKSASIHAGLLGNDTLILLDEVHMAKAFADTLHAVRQRYRKPPEGCGLPDRFGVVQMSATPGKEREGARSFGLAEDDRAHPVLRLRLQAQKPARLLAVDVRGDNEAGKREALAQRAVAAALELQRGGAKVVGLVVNRVDTARLAWALLAKHAEVTERLLVTGRMRPIDRDRLVRTKLLPWAGAGQRAAQGSEGSEGREGSKGSEVRATVVVATQCIEAGADLDFDGLVTECASLDALRQRFGRLDRRGQVTRERGSAPAVILCRTDLSSGREDDAVYGKALAATWAWLKAQAKGDVVGFGISELPAAVAQDGQPLLELLAEVKDAPVLLPAHLDAWVHTSPVLTPSPDPDPALWLHGPEKAPRDVQVVWRADLPGAGEQVPGKRQAELEDELGRVRPSSLEAMTLPIHAVRAWLAEQADARGVADVIEEGPEEEARREDAAKRGRWFVRMRRGEDPEWTTLAAARPRDREAQDELRPGDVVLVPASYGGINEDGTFDPTVTAPATDLGDLAQLRGRGRATLRVTREALRSWALGDDVLGAAPGAKNPDGSEEAEATGALKDRVKRWISTWPGGDAPPEGCLLYTSPSPRDGLLSRMPSSA